MDKATARIGAAMIAAGTLLFGAATMFHPPTVDPWDPTHALTEATGTLWLIDHSVLLVAVLALHLGLFLRHGWVTARSGRRGLSDAAFACSIVSLTVWVALFVFELTGWPLVAKAVQAWFGGPSGMPAPATAGPEGTLALIAFSAWATTLVLGYAAAVLLALAILLWSAEMVRSTGLPRLVGCLGIVAGVANVAASPVAVAFPRLALWLLVPAAGLMGLWFLAAAWAMWRSVR